jgi:hypothetical protein
MFAIFSQSSRLGCILFSPIIPMTKNSFESREELHPLDELVERELDQRSMNESVKAAIQEDADSHRNQISSKVIEG